MRPIAAAPAAFALALLAGACTWVPLTPEGGSVRVASAQEVAGCEPLGHITSITADRILIFARTDRTVSEELRSLARNEAARMGGDAVVPRGPREDGRQTFDIYRCEER